MKFLQLEALRKENAGLGKLLAELLCARFRNDLEARVLAEQWRLEYNHHRPHSSLGHRAPAAFAAGCIASASLTAQPQQYKAENVDNFLIACGA